LQATPADKLTRSDGTCDAGLAKALQAIAKQMPVISKVVRVEEITVVV